MQYSQEHLKTMVYAEFGGQTECIMGNWKIENSPGPSKRVMSHGIENFSLPFCRRFHFLNFHLSFSTEEGQDSWGTLKVFLLLFVLVFLCVVFLPVWVYKTDWWTRK